MKRKIEEKIKLVKPVRKVGRPAKKLIEDVKVNSLADDIQYLLSRNERQLDTNETVLNLLDSQQHTNKVYANRIDLLFTAVRGLAVYSGILTLISLLIAIYLWR